MLRAAIYVSWGFKYLFCLAILFVIKSTCAEDSANNITAAIQQYELHTENEGLNAGARLAQTLGHGVSSGQVGLMASQLASGLFNATMQEKFSSFGTSRAKINLSDNRLEGSEFDILLPWYERYNSLYFSQTGIRRVGGRTMTNVGFGYRFAPFENTLLGFNVFYDHDLSRDHKRLGTGLEFVQDYFRLVSNGYFRLSHWKQSPDLTDYRERVANGFDIRADGWLPAYPQLGGQLTWSRYYGDKVGLFGPANLQKSPHYVAVGVNYTPVPLAGIALQKIVSPGHRQDDLSFSLNVSWQPGMTLKQHLDPNHVRINHTTAGMRYQPVERNNIMVLEYKKDRLFTLPVNTRVAGTENTRLALNLDINSKYSISGIVWKGETFFSSGGEVIYENGVYALLLPEWKDNANNRYLLEGRAMDKKGNLSSSFNVDVEVLPQKIKISLAGDLRGEEGQILAMGLNARSVQAISKINWDAPDFLAAGGKFIQKPSTGNDDYSLNSYAVLPPYKTEGKNEYPVQVTVTDNDGDVSNVSEAKIIVEPRSIVLVIEQNVSGNESEPLKLPYKKHAKEANLTLGWDAPEFIASGGKVRVENEDVWLTLPAWSERGKNQYPFILTARDDQGHHATPARTMISVTSTSIDFSLVERLTGKSGEELEISPQANAKVGIDRIEWQSEPFFRAGGEIMLQDRGVYRVKLPLWSKQGKNRYTLNATAWDKLGRASSTLHMIVEVNPVTISITAPDKIEGDELGIIPAAITITSNTSTPGEIHFSADAFFEAGGKITGSIPDYRFVLPPYKTGESNQYSVQVTGNDALGNVSENVVVNVRVNQVPVMLTAEPGVTGFESSNAAVEMSVESLYGIERYEIDAPEFSAAGGNVESQNNTLRLHLPGFKVGGENRYTIVVRAIDKKGTISAPLQLNVVVVTRLLNANGECSVVGGGNGYLNKIDKNNVQYKEARDYATLKALTENGERYIYIPGDVNIELPMIKNALVIKKGTTLFSDRGSKGSDGARLKVSYKDEQAYKFPVIVMESDTRMSGLRYEGPYGGTTTKNTTIGIQTVSGSRNIEVDNMEMWNWPWAAVSVKQSSDVRVHHSYIHNNIKSQLGYGVVTQNGKATAEVACNLFDQNRHSIAGSGQSGEGYAAHHNLILNGGGRGAYHQFDMHLYSSQKIAGEFMEVVRNWFDFGRYGTSNRSSIGMRGRPERGPITVEDNWFSQGWVVGSQRAVAGQYGSWVPTEDEILSNNRFNVKFKYLDRGDNQCVLDWLSSSQRVNCYGLGY
ncbi:inverse autotransporter beta domain-containing protein [Enterobacter roggenkampii]|uniref:inverse autotransporter beta domain-containing protein n=1 Tax=Enterobacter roggenkampii TaxID=1812935 RepID=UPI002DB5F8A8|nr:inverse autotransporter beta domain-containing protein [Enterobacter roggenkampii]MEB6513686.1 inverse autotransporter beta domain-containing protein [Enterobacter roggenkampii]